MGWAACGAGALILAAVAHVNVLGTGGYGSPHALLTMAVAAGVGVGAIVTGLAWADHRRALAGFLVAAMLAGEAYGFIATAERLITSREAAQAPLRAALVERGKAERQVEIAARALASLQPVSVRLQEALMAKAAIDAAIIAKSDARGCVENCRRLLQAQAVAASQEIDQARAEIGRQRSQAEQELETARSILADLKAPVSATPLADRIGWPGWVVDLLQSALGSLAANGLACALMVFGAHRRQLPAHQRVLSQPDEQSGGAVRRLRRVRRKRGVHIDHAAEFALARLQPAAEGAADLTAVFRAYQTWCRIRGVEPLAQEDIGGALRTLFENARLPIQLVDGRPVVLGAVLRGPDAEAVRPADS